MNQNMHVSSFLYEAGVLGLVRKIPYEQNPMAGEGLEAKINHGGHPFKEIFDESGDGLRRFFAGNG